MPISGLESYKSALEELSEPVSQSNIRYFPLAGNSRLTQNYGEGHGGVDFGAVTGTPVVSPEQGIVTSVQHLTTGYGQNVRVETPEGETLIFGHLQNIFAKVGQRLRAGEPIGTVGSTGNSSGPHLHFERRDSGGGTLDPWPLLQGTIKPNEDALQYGVNPSQQSLVSKTPVTTIDVDSQDAKQKTSPVRNYGLYGVSVSPEAEKPINVSGGDIGASFTSLNDLTNLTNPVNKDGSVNKVGTWNDIKSTLKETGNRFAVGGLGVILIVTGLMIVSKGLRQQASGLVNTAVSGATGGLSNLVTGG